MKYLFVGGKKAGMQEVVEEKDHTLPTLIEVEGQKYVKVRVTIEPLTFVCYRHENMLSEEVWLKLVIAYVRNVTT